MNEWKYVKPLDSNRMIQLFEKYVDYRFPASFKNVVSCCNGGRPQRCTFDTGKQTGRIFKSLLSFDKDDRETIWKICPSNLELRLRGYVPFGLDPFGNWLCFNVDTDAVVFVDHEAMNVEPVADSFDQFLATLY